MNHPNGFTLLETTLFITLLAVGATVMLQIFPLFMAQLDQATQTIPATFLADGTLEEILADFHNNGLEYLTNSHYPQQSPTVTITTVSQSANRYNCTATPAGPTDSPKCVTVTVGTPLLAQSRLFLWKKSP